jgi:ribosomal protein L7/L12
MNRNHNFRPISESGNKEFDPQLVRQIKNILVCRSMIQAVKFYRQETGTGLQEAIAFVKAIQGAR